MFKNLCRDADIQGCARSVDRPCARRYVRR